MSEQTIKAIETSYCGYKFRSRTEARWAVFFDALGIKWEYEKEGFDLGDAGWYLPDFWIDEWKCWIEIKGKEPCRDDYKKIRKLASNDAPVLLLCGLPGIPASGTFYCLDIDDGGGGPCVISNVAIGYCDNCQKYTLSFGQRDTKYTRGDRTLCNGDWGAWSGKCNCYPPSVQRIALGDVQHAVEAARSARFEHGENPAKDVFKKTSDMLFVVEGQENANAIKSLGYDAISVSEVGRMADLPMWVKEVAKKYNRKIVWADEKEASMNAARSIGAASMHSNQGQSANHYAAAGKLSRLIELMIDRFRK